MQKPPTLVYPVEEGPRAKVLITRTNMNTITALSLLLVILTPNTFVNGCKCTNDKDQVCGDDGKTYRNECQLFCLGSKGQGNTVKHSKIDWETKYKLKLFQKLQCRGKCPCEETEKCVCYLQYQPICAEDGKTYFNECAATCTNQVSISTF